MNCCGETLRRDECGAWICWNRTTLPLAPDGLSYCSQHHPELAAARAERSRRRAEAAAEFRIAIAALREAERRTT